jgi:AraC-like DNA-binding protein
MLQPMTGHAAPTRGQHTVPVTLVRQLVELLKRWKIQPDELLASFCATAALTDPLGRVPLETMLGLLARARLLTGEPGLGYYLALHERVSTYGCIGLAASSAATVKGSIDLAIQYAPLFSTALSISLQIEGRRALLRLDENVDLGSVRDIILINMMLGLETMAHALTGRREHGVAEVAMPEPPYNARFAHLIPRWRFGQPANLFVIEADALDWPVLAADPVSLDLMRALCERSLRELGLDQGLVERVRRVLVRDSGGLHSLKEVADRMRLTPRTLTRRLAAQGASFSSVVERVRHDQALVLLRSFELSIEEIARRLDYASASTFVRAFRSWTGRTPAAYRRERG